MLMEKKAMEGKESPRLYRFHRGSENCLDSIVEGLIVLIPNAESSPASLPECS